MITILLIGYLKMLYKQGKLPATCNKLLQSVSKCQQKKGLLFIFMLSAIHTTAQVLETRSYAVYKNQQLIGRLEAKKISGNQCYTIFLHSINHIRIITSLKIEVMQKDSFTAHKLSAAQLTSKINGFTKSNKTYAADEFSKHRFTNYDALPTNEISFTTSSIYFFEPIGIKSLYSSNFHQMLPVQKKENGIYEIVLPDGKVNSYYFKNGICIAATLHSSYAVVNIKLIQ